MPEALTSGFIVRFPGNFWLAEGRGDPPRTLIEANAKRYKTYGAALHAVAYWIDCCPFRESLRQPTIYRYPAA